MKRILTPEEARLADRSYIARGETSLLLMERAARGLKEAVLSLMAERGLSKALCLCGRGNNGGDGIAAALQLKEAGVDSALLLLPGSGALTFESAYYLNKARAAGVRELRELPALKDTAVIDALFGVGLSRPLKGEALSFVQKLNQSGASVVSADLPSGLNGLTGEVLGEAVKATVTVAMGSPKTGCFFNRGMAYTGTLRVCPITLLPLPEELNTGLRLFDEAEAKRLLPPRERDSHKGKNGKALLCAGSQAYTGAALLAGKAALSAGCGILTLACPDALRPQFSALPEAITLPVGDGWEKGCFKALAAFAGKDAIAIGPGMGKEDFSPLLQGAMESGLPLVLDADGLNVLAEHKELMKYLSFRTVLTPHPGEMARLTGESMEALLLDPPGKAAFYAKAWGCTVLLKGTATVISDGERTVLTARGNSGLAKGGSGDALTGVILGLMAQGLGPFDCACLGSYLLGVSAEKAFSLLQERMLRASDVIEALQIL